MLPKSPVTKSPPALLQQLCLTGREGDASFQLHCILTCPRASVRPKVPFSSVLASPCRVHYKQNTFQEFMPRIIYYFGLQFFFVVVVVHFLKRKQKPRHLAATQFKDQGWNTKGPAATSGADPLHLPYPEAFTILNPIDFSELVPKWQAVNFIIGPHCFFFPG